MKKKRLAVSGFFFLRNPLILEKIKPCYLLPTQVPPKPIGLV
jgi:hypothetical protein